MTSCVLIICIGLSVDFSAHMVHAFMHSSGGDVGDNDNLEEGAGEDKETPPKSKTKGGGYRVRQRRMRASLEAIAPAILHGGFSTLLAVILLSFSEVYVFVAFFKVRDTFKRP